jgi:hypothetical protein
VQQDNGHVVRLEQPFILSDQSWQISQQFTTLQGEHVCAISAGDLEVVQRSGEHGIVRQVGSFNRLAPGDYYKILVDGRVYETPQGWFDPAQSETIIRKLMESRFIYTETRKMALGFRSSYRNIDNKIPMDGFASYYQSCERFVTSKHKRKGK